ncbi:unnamed protein product [Owenia fusiformis]|uniref:Uncharacterized protein n=1 Tax=Owenia fusiformis TaxID=6347 RepID=A0A8J1TTM9_OWEFU|nr:unnamed protein product [Owenia fusiformis]
MTTSRRCSLYNMIVLILMGYIGVHLVKYLMEEYSLQTPMTKTQESNAGSNVPDGIDIDSVNDFRDEESQRPVNSQEEGFEYLKHAFKGFQRQRSNALQEPKIIIKSPIKRTPFNAKVGNIRTNPPVDTSGATREKSAIDGVRKDPHDKFKKYYNGPIQQNSEVVYDHKLGKFTQIGKDIQKDHIELAEEMSNRQDQSRNSTAQPKQQPGEKVPSVQPKIKQIVEPDETAENAEADHDTKAARSTSASDDDNMDETDAINVYKSKGLKGLRNPHKLKDNVKHALIKHYYKEGKIEKNAQISWNRRLGKFVQHGKDTEGSDFTKLFHDPKTEPKQNITCHPSMNLLNNNTNSNILFEPDTCSSNPVGPFLLIVVTIPPMAYERLALIRKTYGTVSKLQGLAIEVVFVTEFSSSNLIQSELEFHSDNFKDILQIRSLKIHSQKMAMFKWLEQRCKNVQFILITKHDIFVNVFSLIHHLQYFFSGGSAPSNFVSCKTLHVYKDNTTPEDIPRSYCSRHGYVITRDILPKFSQYLSTKSKLFPSDITHTFAEATGLKVDQTLSESLVEEGSCASLMTGGDLSKYTMCEIRDNTEWLETWNKIASVNVHA